MVNSPKWLYRIGEPEGRPGYIPTDNPAVILMAILERLDFLVAMLASNPLEGNGSEKRSQTRLSTDKEDKSNTCVDV